MKLIILIKTAYPKWRMFDIENNSDSCDQILYCCDQKQYHQDFNPSNVLIQIDDSKFSQQNGWEFNKQKEIEGTCLSSHVMDYYWKISNDLCIQPNNY